MTNFFTADPHFCHGGRDGRSGIIHYCDRPFKDVEEMNQKIVSNWNKVVKEEDSVYLLGDIGFPKYEWEITQLFYSLNGKIQLVLGNHDHNKRNKMLKWKSLMKRFDWVGEYKEISIEDPDADYRGNKYNKIVLSHYPIYSWNGMHHGSWMLHGHTHGTCFLKDNKILDVGMDCWGFLPVSYERVKLYMNHREFVPVDGHGKKGDYKCGLSGSTSSK